MMVIFSAAGVGEIYCLGVHTVHMTATSWVALALVYTSQPVAFVLSSHHSLRANAAMIQESGYGLIPVIGNIMTTGLFTAPTAFS